MSYNQFVLAFYALFMSWALYAASTDNLIMLMSVAIVIVVYTLVNMVKFIKEEK
jgi:hypothetical protein